MGEVGNVAGGALDGCGLFMVIVAVVFVFVFVCAFIQDKLNE